MYRSIPLVVCFSIAALAAAHADPAPAAPLPPATTADTGSAAADTPPAPTPPAAPAAPAAHAADDIDLSSLGLDANGDGGFDDKLNIYGFADFSWQYEDFVKGTPYAPNTNTFALGNLNLYVAKNLTPQWRTLAEVRFMYAPDASPNGDGTTSVTTASDVTNFNRSITWGTISIERAYVEYDATSWLTIRAGHWLTPYGIWNTDHGSPVIIGAYRPYIIGEELIPEHQTGIDLFGAKMVGDYKLGYHATISNGRSQTEIVQATDRRPAFGGRIELEAPWDGTFKLGASGYIGRYTSAVISTTVPNEQYDERGLAADVQWDHGGLHLQAEVLDRHRAWTAGHRTVTLVGAPEPDGSDFGAYVLGGYRFHALWNVMPFAYYENFRPLDPGELGNINDVNAGLNFRPTSTVVLKLQGAYAVGSSAGLIQSNVFVATTQVAWVF
jgi:hypothetical protein